VAVSDIGANVRRHMKIRGLTVPALAKEGGIGTATLSNLLNGKSEPKSSTLIALATALGVPVAQLVADSPELKSLRFRTAKTLSGREKAEKDELRHDTALWLANYRFLEERLGTHQEYALGRIAEDDPWKAAAAVRKVLDLGALAIADLPELMERAGVKLRIRPFGFQRTFGLSVADTDGGPAIVVNSGPKISIERQLFSIAHELGHLVLHRNSYDASKDDVVEEEERSANLFAGQFLVPDDALDKAWGESRGLHWVNSVLRIKKQFKVSYMTVLVRLSQRLNRPVGTLIAQFRKEYAERYSHQLKDHYEPDSIAGPVADSDPQNLDQTDLMEDRFAWHVRRAFEKEIISIGRAGEMLGLPLEEMRALARAWQEV
jgi:Zn-dependent peptidase ImmA (M78 family)/lambda repressor-like predicted transcriptional regulator